MGGRRFGRPFPSRVVLGQRSHRRNVPLGFLAHIFLHTLNNLPLTSCAPNLFAIRTAIYSRAMIAHRVLHSAFPTRTRLPTLFLTLFSHLHRPSVSARLRSISFEFRGAIVRHRALLLVARLPVRISTPWKVGKKKQRNPFRPAAKSRVSSSLFGCFLFVFLKCAGMRARKNAAALAFAPSVSFAFSFSFPSPTPDWQCPPRGLSSLSLSPSPSLSCFSFRRSFLLFSAARASSSVSRESRERDDETRKRERHV